MDLLWSEGLPGRVRHFVLELTSECNVRCAYCPRTRTAFGQHRVLDDDTSDRVLRHLQTHGIRRLDLVGGGEMTAAPRWRERCERFLDLGIALSTTINMARTLTTEEIRTLCRFDVVNVSLDSIDQAVLRRVRMGTDVRTVVHNFMMIRAAQVSSGRREPLLGVTAVYSAEMVHGIDRLAAFAAAAGANAFGIQDLVEYQDLDDNARSVWTLDGPEALEAAERTRSALRIARGAKLNVHVQPEFEERVEDLAWKGSRGEDRALRRASEWHATYMKPVPSGFTRACLDPWIFTQVLGDGTVRPCCYSNVSVGRLDAETPLGAVWNGDRIRRLRADLLNGTLDANCSICTGRPRVPVETLRSQVAELFAPNTEGARDNVDASA